MLKVLVIDPSDDFRSVLEEVIVANDHRVRTSPTFDDAVHIGREWAPDMILVETVLLGSDAERAGALRRALPSVRCVIGMVTARYSQTSHLGCDSVVEKPFEVAALMRDVARMLSREH
jgi:DNA-binding response OmpR family regulator